MVNKRIRKKKDREEWYPYFTKRYHPRTNDYLKYYHKPMVRSKPYLKAYYMTPISESDLPF